MGTESAPRASAWCNARHISRVYGDRRVDLEPVAAGGSVSTRSTAVTTSGAFGHAVPALFP